MHKNKKAWPISPFIVISLIAMFCMGFILGMVGQQQIFMEGLIVGVSEVAKGFEGADIEINIDLNETLLIDRMVESLRTDEE